MSKKKNRMVPIRFIGKPDRKPRQAVPLNTLNVYAANSKQEIEWFDQPARKWRRIEKKVTQ